MKAPSYFNTVHGTAVDPVTRYVYVIHRANRRTQAFDENGKFSDQWSFGPVSIAYTLYLSADRNLWVPDSKTWKILKYDRQRHFLYSWGTRGDWPGGIWGPTLSASTSKATWTWPKSRTAVSRSSGREKVRIRHTCLDCPCAEPGRNKACK
jgi:DNA-binding beta-propeller fold protein YncE